MQRKEKTPDKRFECMEDKRAALTTEDNEIGGTCIRVSISPLSPGLVSMTRKVTGARKMITIRVSAVNHLNRWVILLLHFLIFNSRSIIFEFWKVKRKTIEFLTTIKNLMRMKMVCVLVYAVGCWLSHWLTASRERRENTETRGTSWLFAKD